MNILKQILKEILIFLSSVFAINLILILWLGDFHDSRYFFDLIFDGLYVLKAFEENYLVYYFLILFPYFFLKFVHILLNAKKNFKILNYVSLTIVLLTFVYIVPREFDCQITMNHTYTEGTYYKGEYHACYKRLVNPLDGANYVAHTVKFATNENEFSSFEVLSNDLAKSKKNVYYTFPLPQIDGLKRIGDVNSTVQFADPDTFEIIPYEGLARFDFAKDKNNIYVQGYKIRGREIEPDPETFEVFGDFHYYPYAKDKNNVYVFDIEQKGTPYLYGYVLNNADPETFELVYGTIGKDKNNVYNRVNNSIYDEYEIVDYLDSKTLRYDEERKTFIDKNGEYAFEKKYADTITGLGLIEFSL